VSTRKVLLGMQKAETLDELISREGRDAVGGYVDNGNVCLPCKTGVVDRGGW
jgi:hypothetical protein